MSSHSRLRHWRDRIVGMGEVSTSPPAWILPQWLLPGLNLIAGDPKTFKSTLAMYACAMIACGTKMKAHSGIPPTPPKSRGTCFVLAYEQSAGRLRHMFETRIIKSKVKQGWLDVSFFKDAFDWRLDEPTADENMVDFIREVKPTAVLVDPWAQAHSQDENDPRSTHHLVPLRKAALAANTALVLIHHNNKRTDVGATNKVRGTTALWGMADSGHFLTKTPGGKVHVLSEFKDFPARAWVWEVR